jgi:hypothetical protein
MIMELAMVNNMQDVNGNERFISVAPTWATITSAVRFHDKRQQAVDDEEDAAGRPTATLQFPLGAAVPGQLQSFDHARLFLLDDNLIHRGEVKTISAHSVLEVRLCGVSAGVHHAWNLLYPTSALKKKCPLVGVVV